MYLLEIVDSAVSGFPLLFVGLFECLVINWIYGKYDIYFIFSIKAKKYIYLCFLLHVK